MRLAVAGPPARGLGGFSSPLRVRVLVLVLVLVLVPILVLVLVHVAVRVLVLVRGFRILVLGLVFLPAHARTHKKNNLVNK